MDFDFEKTLDRHPFTLKQDGVIQLCYLQELTGLDRDRYLQELSARTRLDATGKPAGLKDFKGFSSSLLKRGCYRVELEDIISESEISEFKEEGFRTAEGKLVPASEIESWPTRIQEALLDRLKDMSGMGDKKDAEEDDAKND